MTVPTLLEQSIARFIRLRAICETAAARDREADFRLLHSTQPERVTDFLGSLSRRRRGRLRNLIFVYEGGGRARSRCFLAAEARRWLRVNQDRRRDFRVVALFAGCALLFDFSFGRLCPVRFTPRRAVTRSRPRSRLDGFIDRMKAQRDCLDAAGAAVSSMSGKAIELGVGAGRTLDHLLHCCPDTPIHVFDWKVRNAPGLAIRHVGDIRETLPAHAALNGGTAKLVHSDVVGGPEADPMLMLKLADEIVELLALGGILVSNTETSHDQLQPLSLPKGIRRHKYFMYTRV